MLDSDIIKNLIEELRFLEGSKENAGRRKVWMEFDNIAHSCNLWRGLGNKPSDNGGKVAYYIEPENPMLCELVGINIKDFYENPGTHLLFQLKQKLFRFKNYKDDMVIDKMIAIRLGYVLEHTLFGMKVIERKGLDPIIEQSPMISDKADLLKLKLPDFFESGLMPKVHFFYEKINSILKDAGDFLVDFPHWAAGPWPIATHLRGMERLALDIYDDPKFVHDLMNFITQSHIEWVKQRNKFLKTPISETNLDNDEVNGMMLSPTSYEEFVFPYENKIANFHGGVFYWHSCGDITKLFPKIQNLLNLRMLHISPWSDMKKIVSEIKSDIVLEKCLHPVNDVLMASKEKIKNTLKDIVKVFNDHPYTVRADGFFVLNDLSCDQKKLQEWAIIADEILHKNII